MENNTEGKKTQLNKKPRIYNMTFVSVYLLYITKVEKKSRTKGELDEAILLLTGYNQEQLQKQIDDKVDFETFFEQAPLINPNSSKIIGSICGYKVQEISDPLMQKIRFMDKLVDEITKGKTMEKILRK